MAELKLWIAGQLGATPKQRKAPWCKLEGQVKMLVHSIDSEPEHRHVEKRRIRNRHARLPEKRTDVEFDLVAAAKHAVTLGDWMHQVAIGCAYPFGDKRRIRLEPSQPHRQPTRGHAPRYIDRVNGDSTRFVLIARIRHAESLSRCTFTEGKAKPATLGATMQILMHDDRPGGE